jgi:hypothetical protein
MLTGPLAQSLDRRRDAFNARFAAAQKGGARIDGPAFLRHLAEVVDPIVRAVAALFPEKTDATVAALYDQSLDLFAANLLGPESCCPPVVDAWRRLLPALPRLVAREPARVAASITNAVHNLAATPNARPTEWIDNTLALAAHLADTHALLEVGKILAWRAGLPRYRDGVLAAARQLDPGLAALSLDLPADTAGADIAKILDRMTEDPWLSPADALKPVPETQPLRIAARVGAFRGFGGPFIRPPTVRTVDHQFVVHDGEHTWHLIADLYGHQFQRADVPYAPASRNAPEIGLDDAGTISWGRTAYPFDELARFTSLAYDGHTLAVTVKTSHHVYLLTRG